MNDDNVNLLRLEAARAVLAYLAKLDRTQPEYFLGTRFVDALLQSSVVRSTSTHIAQNETPIPFKASPPVLKNPPSVQDAQR